MLEAYATAERDQHRSRWWYFARGLSRRPSSRGAALAAIACGALVAACGGSATPADRRAPAAFRVAVTRATFPVRQRLAQRTRLVITVLNVGRRAIPNIAVTITNPRYGTAAKPFSALIAPQPGLASRSRPVWIVDRPPGRCIFQCPAGGAGGAVTAYSNTWALGRLAPGRAATFSWSVTAVTAGRYLLAYRVAAGLQVRGRAVLADGRPAAGVFAVAILRAPRRPYVKNNGRVVYAP
jgi:hypothetical protein